MLDVENPEFFQRLDKLVVTNTQLINLGKEGGPMAALQKIGVIASFATQLLGIFLMKPAAGGAIDLVDDTQLAY